MGVSYFERNGIFASNCTWSSFSFNGVLIPRRPIFPVGLTVKKVHVFGVKVQNNRAINALLKGESDKDNRLVGGGILEKELQFKPSFNEYLKAMESVRVRRERKQADNNNNNNTLKKQKPNDTEKGLFRTPTMEGDKGTVELKEFEKKKSILDQEKVIKVVKHEGLSKKDYGIASKESQVRRGKLGYKGKASKEFVDEIDTNEGHISGKLMKQHQTSGIQQKLEDSNLGKSTKAWRVQKVSKALVPVQRQRHSIKLEGEIVGDASSWGMLTQKGTDNSQWDDKSINKTFKGEKIGAGIDRHGRRERKYFQVEEVANNDFLREKGTLTRRGHSFSERIDGNGADEERAAFKNFDEFSDVVDKPRVSRMEMEERIQKLAKQLNGADVDMPEWMFTKTMRSARIRFCDHSILRVIQILGKLGNWRRVLQVVEWLQMRERFKSHRPRFIYTTALDVLGKANRPVEALNVFHSMQQQVSTYPDLVAYQCIAVTLGKAGYLKELFDVIDSMRSPPKKKFKTGVIGKWDPELEPDIMVYNAVLNACVQQEKWEGAFWVLQQLKQQGQKPSSTTYGLVMEVMFACGKYNLVHEFFRKLQKFSIPNALTYKVVVNTLWKEGKTDEALLAVQHMERRGIVGSAALYYDLARCLCTAGRCQEALKLMEKICKVANKPLVVTYTGLIQACIDSGNIEDGAYIFKEMQNFCSPNLVSCNIMLKAYLEHGMFEEAKKLFNMMSEDRNHISRKSDYRARVIPDIYTFNTMLDACIAEKRWDDFENIYRGMLHHGFHFNAKRHLRMILNASGAVKGVLLETTWNHLTKADRNPPPALVKEKFCMKLENDDYMAALACITSHSMPELQAFSNSAWLNLLEENAHRFRKDALFRLIQEVGIHTNRTELSNLAVQNLVSACKEFFRTNMTLAEIKEIETVCSAQTELAFKS
ncbi:pentatricopeptide repeat-containing protein At1g30610, chloroplastic-like isoform X2 [Quercus robur]|uniref:pentatricopeptide repeat-containing protein At1g30610, chloroplastic-like isoform X2 n=1 Tax=Quercus robur TaxID=38942 RepID=UPI002163A927|nr:pentatricopeptide repeat-containing protein At1g30610, chloroplastic-like isoform X2 [Quercus robur]